ncbi:hypothetical protein [Peterkaempfera sp. SMS 1(5)a]|uniref:hypothetical protein n=1 Tax=Peterkaempfera podocarpi TaxID=3232308 RepID=UPI003670A411
MTAPNDPRVPPPSDDGTVHLRRRPQPQDAPQDAPPPATPYQPTAHEPTPYQPTAHEPAPYQPTVREPAPYQPTVRDWTPAPEPDPPQSEAEPLIRFGPGVPDPQTARTVEVWRGGTVPAAPQPAARRPQAWRRYILAGAVLLAVLGYLFWRQFGPSLAVQGVTAATTPARLGCDATATVTATVRTNGHGGTLRFRWVRSDGTDSGPMTQQVAEGSHQVQVPLRWTVQGHGSFHGTATLQLTAPRALQASAGFDYDCP